MAHHPTQAAGSGQTTLPAPGQPWPEQRAHFAGVVHAPALSWALLMPTVVPALPDQAWGRYGKRIDGADSVIDGYTNTLDMVAAGNELAKAVRALSGDCYLPSPLETMLLYASLREVIGTGAVWTSRQYSAVYAWCQRFGDGGQYFYGKDAERRAVPVRRLVLRSFDASLEDRAEAEVA